MTEDDAVRIATRFLESQWKGSVELIGARSPTKKVPEWTAFFNTWPTGAKPGGVMDPPTLVTVDPATSEARLFASM